MSTVRLTRAIVGALVVLLVLGLTGGTAAAHAELLSSNPSADSVLQVAPSEILLTFSESIDTVPDSIRVVTGDGDDVDLGSIRQDEGGQTIAADLPDLTDGSYVVAWRAVSADSHPISGAFVFSVGQKVATDPDLIAGLLADTKPSSGAERWLGLGRGASYLGVAGLIGVAVVLSELAPQLLPGRRAGRVLFACIAIGAVGTVVMIAAQASVAFGGWTAWRDVFHSSAGRWWFVRLWLVALAVTAVVFRGRATTARWRPLALAIGAVAMLAVVAAGGHGVTGRYVTLAFVATVVHLAAVSTWFGGLVAIALVAPRREIVGLATRFSPIALGSVVVLAVTGVFNAWRQIGSWDALTDSGYGTWLIVKLVVLGLVLAVAATNRWLIRHHAPIGEDGAISVGGGMARTLLAEVAGIVLVFAATAGLVNAAPPHASAPPSVASATVVAEGRLAQITLDPPVTGGTAMHVYLSSTTGALEQPTDITVTATLAAQSIGPLTLPTNVAGPGHVTSSDADLPIAGTWTFSITARYSEFDQTTFTVELAVR